MAENFGMVQIKTAQEVMDEIERENEARNSAENSAVSDAITQLTGFVDKKWEDAKRSKITIEDEMLSSIRQKNGEYDPIKLAQIVEAKQPEIFMNITATKCRNAVAWIKDIMFQPKGRIFSVEPTTIPELPAHITQGIQNVVVQEYVNMAIQEAMQTGQRLPSEQLKGLINQHAEDIKKEIMHKAIDTARELSEEISDKIEDDWMQGGFYKALDLFIEDVVSLKAGFIKGPIFRKERIRKTVMGPDGKLTKQVEEKIVPQYERRSPFRIYPTPRSTGVNNGGLFDVIAIRPKQLYDLIGVDGYDEKEIRAVLREFRGGSLKNDWLQLSDSAKEGMGEDTKDEDKSQYPEETIYCLELWDEIPGEMLKEWGLNVEDEDAEYPCCVWKIGNHVIKAMLTYDILGRKPYFKTSFQTVNDSFWGQSVPELIADCQQVCNACARSILSNIGMGSLPQIGLNVERLEMNASRTVIPGKVWPFTEEQMASNVDPIKFFQPTMVTEKLMNVYFAFSKIADEHSGVPAYAHGDSQVGGAGNTAAGLSMLVSQASRGIKAVIRNIDHDVISGVAEYHYDYLLDNSDIFGLFGDYKIKARGSEALIALEQQATRKLEYLTTTMNPVDLQLVGMENRRKVLFEVAKGFGIELDNNVIPQQPHQLQGQVPPQDPRTLDAAGNPAQGVDTAPPQKGEM